MEEKIEFIYLVQHGKSFSEEQNPKKPLLDVGVEETGRVADFLKSKNIKIDIIWHSNKLRSIQTAQIFSRVLEVKDVLQKERLGPLDDVFWVKDEIENLSCKSLMIVGHLPFLEKLYSLLIIGKIQDKRIVKFVNSAVVCISRGKDNFHLEWMITPSIVK